MSGEDPTPEPRSRRAPDLRADSVYIMSDRIDLAVKVALATGRPLLLRGEPGSGKSSLAPYIAQDRGWRYYEHVVTSRTAGKDLLWTYDQVRRLSDAQVRAAGAGRDAHETGPTVELRDEDYVTPGSLWWAFDPRSAAGDGNGRGRVDPFWELNVLRSPDGSVVLIDEIDKADPDMPNSLLVPLGSEWFLVQETGQVIRREPTAPGGGHLVIITTNEERELPQAFLRRCVVLALEAPDGPRLMRIAEAHFRVAYGEFTPDDRSLTEELAGALLTTRAQARDKGMRPPNTAEFLDALHACKQLAIDTGDPRWEQLKELTLLKSQQPEA
ncbi:AAA family ATPase [Streptomyces sp. NPDC050548]|uniref:AAA family ATPase n=1 Tax=Streptomyces sp. NPDC050548 TaxID=3365629 RepID=UPI0037AC5996